MSSAERISALVSILTLAISCFYLAYRAGELANTVEMQGNQLAESIELLRNDYLGHERQWMDFLLREHGE